MLSRRCGKSHVDHRCGPSLPFQLAGGQQQSEPHQRGGRCHVLPGASMIHRNYTTSMDPTWGPIIRRRHVTQHNRSNGTHNRWHPTGSTFTPSVSKIKEPPRLQRCMGSGPSSFDPSQSVLNHTGAIYHAPVRLLLPRSCRRMDTRRWT